MKEKRFKLNYINKKDKFNFKMKINKGFYKYFIDLYKPELL